MPESATELRIPRLKENCTPRGAALAYAKAGWYVIPLRRGTKHPGSILGDDWPELSTRDRDDIKKWWPQGTDRGIALHVGKSGAFAIDIDRPEHLPEWLSEEFEGASYHWTSRERNRRHVLFLMPKGRTLGNGMGALRNQHWGEVRGKNGVIAVYPSVHPDEIAPDKAKDPDDPGLYRWGAIAPLFPLPESVASMLNDASAEVTALESDAELDAFLDSHKGNAEPYGLKGAKAVFENRDKLQRHPSMVDALCMAFREAIIGRFPARQAHDELRALWVSAFEDQEGRRPDDNEFLDMAKYCAAAAQQADPAETRAKVDRDKPDDERADIDKEKHRLLIRHRAKEEFQAELAALHFYALPRETLAQAFERPRDKTPHRIEGLHKVGYNSTVSGRYKTGKTHINANKLRALADNVPFLDRFDILPPDGRIGVLNYELDEADFFDWLSYVGIAKTDRVAPLNLRGRRFSLASPRNVDELVKWCREMEVEVLDLDPHRRAFSGFGKENDNDDVNRFTETLDEVKTAAGVRDLFLYVHMGREQHEQGTEHARGATALDDWADQRWLLTKVATGDRFLYAEGRLPDVPEFQVQMDPATRRLFAADGNRKASRNATLTSDAQAAIAKAPGCNTTELIEAMKLGKSKDGGAAELRSLLDAQAGHLWRKVVRRNGGAKRWFPMSTSQPEAEAAVNASGGLT
ncbi:MULTISPECIES: bifunctional DNA primase/polymerase [unclassified Pseudonocardia]|uniref:bifunctional DNA primase/polymerase n=1 Tax=unclassified Pseudonocardia TaxID=2619320 RepID=UPI00094B1E48|nr:bifunctional DNA primase/polymerase [Pseudonocardia sp. Ae707_Ps1]OLM21306.1 hypothetical protein Ae707Ps1_5565 [Pseudonocardia sp. Ae707_Ps1]